jgi:hypothetical protein
VPATLTLRDNFTRANAALTTPYLNNAVLGTTIPQVISNQVGTTAYGGFVRDDALGADQGIRFTLSVAGSDAIAVWVRGTALSLDNATTQSLLIYIDVDYCGLWKYTKAGGYAAIHEPTFPAAPIASGSIVQLEVTGNTVTVYDDGVLWQTFTGANAITSGAQAGVEFGATDTRIDDLYSGSLAETHSGSGRIAGGGVLRPVGQKIAVGSVRLVGGGITRATGSKTATGALRMVGGGIIRTAGSKTGQGRGTVSGGGVLRISGVKVGTGITRLSGGGILAVRGTKTTTGSSRVVGGGRLLFSGDSDSPTAPVPSIRLPTSLMIDDVSTGLTINTVVTGVLIAAHATSLAIDDVRTELIFDA